MRVVGWWLLVGAGLLAAYYAATTLLVGGFLLLGDRLPALMLGGAVASSLLAVGIGLVERWRRR